MKGLKKLALVSAIAAVSAGAQAELKALDDSTMGNLTGQAGLTIDVETKFTIGEFAYKDAGFLVIQGISVGGVGNTADALAGNDTDMIDNLRLVIDVAGAAGEPLRRGLSDFYGVDGLAKLAKDLGNADETGTLAKLAGIELATLEANPTGIYAGTVTNAMALAGVVAAQAAVLGNTDGVAEKNRADISDGDLLIHFIATDHLINLGGAAANLGGKGPVSAVNFQTLAGAVVTSVDFKIGVDAIGIASSGYVVGSKQLQKTDHATGLDTNPNTTTLISDLSIQGFFGHKDLHIENNGNGFGGGTGVGDADSKIHYDAYYNITDLDVYIDIAGVKLEDIKINNMRGDRSGLDGLNAFGFAHSMRDIFAVKDTVLNYSTIGAGNQTGLNPEGFVDGIAINTMSKFDMDIGALSFGDTGTSIGSIHLTDVTNTTNWTISAH